MIVVGRLQYPDAATARADGWRLDNCGTARRAAPCPSGGRHKARRYPQDGALPRCWRCGEVFAVETATWQYVKVGARKRRRTHGNGPSLSAKHRGRPTTRRRAGRARGQKNANEPVTGQEMTGCVCCSWVLLNTGNFLIAAGTASVLL